MEHHLHLKPDQQIQTVTVYGTNNEAIPLTAEYNYVCKKGISYDGLVNGITNDVLPLAIQDRGIVNITHFNMNPGIVAPPIPNLGRNPILPRGPRPSPIRSQNTHLRPGRGHFTSPPGKPKLEIKPNTSSFSIRNSTTSKAINFGKSSQQQQFPKNSVSISKIEESGSSITTNTIQEINIPAPTKVLVCVSTQTETVPESKTADKNPSTSVAVTPIDEFAEYEVASKPSQDTPMDSVSSKSVRR